MTNAGAPLSTHLMLDYLVELGSELLEAGCPTYRLEELLVTVARHEGFNADVFAVPTGLFVGVRTPTGEAPAVSMVRVTEWGIDLERLAVLDELLNRVIDRTLSVSDARLELRRLSAVPRWPTAVRLLAGAGSSAGAAILFGGSVSDFFIAGVGGVLLRAILLRTQREPGLRFLENFLGGAVAAVTAWFATLFWPGHSRDVLVLAVVIPLLPGMVLTTGLAEITFKNLVSGTARLVDAAVTLLSLVFGIGLVLSFEQWTGVRPEPAGLLAPAAWWWQAMAIVVASLSFGVSLGLPRPRLGIAVASGSVVWLAQLVLRSWTPTPAAFVSAVVLAASANAFARSTRKPAQLFLLPGLLLLVPGSFGFKSFDALLRGDYTQGASQAVDMFTLAGALVMGLLVANVVVPPRKIL
ncbi:MAG: threonine/serine exporter family protein [Myxococcaceae bacterium]|nr:threonine/serine exporter family protein [Myxococcaceae bacterium]